MVWDKEEHPSVLTPMGESSTELGRAWIFCGLDGKQAADSAGDTCASLSKTEREVLVTAFAFLISICDDTVCLLCGRFLGQGWWLVLRSEPGTFALSYFYVETSFS